MSTTYDVDENEMENSDEMYQCSVCDGEYSLEADEPIELKGNDICPYCRESCPTCGEFIDDEHCEELGPPVNFRWYATNGKRQTEHAECAAETILSGFAYPNFFSLDHATREEIAGIVAVNFAAAKVVSVHPQCRCVPSREHLGWWVIVKHMPAFNASDVIAEGRTWSEAWLDAAKEVA